MVVDIFVSKAQPIDPLREHLSYAVIHEPLIAMVTKTCSELVEDAVPEIYLAQQQCSGVRSNGTTVKISHDISSPKPLKHKLFCITLFMQFWPLSSL